MMDVKDSIEERQSIRKYKNKDVPLKTIGEILAIAKHSPSSGNLQNWRFVIVKDRKKRERLAEAALNQMWMATAPVHLVICNKLDDISMLYGERGRELYSIQNCAIMGAYIMLLARSFGLETCWVGAFDEDAVKIVLGIPDTVNVRPEAVIAIGYGDEKKAKTKRRDIEALSYFEDWGKKG